MKPDIRHGCNARAVLLTVSLQGSQASGRECRGDTKVESRLQVWLHTNFLDT
eukprot:NODE_22987_length_685_cov_21.014337.p5 GENE.NODE_22987_length_685_cov_21.014337~~NODE_22987_length_685_cov_21.014337.p5  ORF type:complete len:52 (+),score=3.43 NODE_22987_length_685_cov_21.014337:462-617(+)